MPLVVTTIEYPKVLTGVDPKGINTDTETLVDMYRKSPGLSAMTDKGIHDDLFDNDEGLKCAVAYDKAGNTRKLRGFIQYVVESEYGFAHINNLYVDPHERKRGIGRALLDQVIGEATKEGVDDLELFATEEAIAFYKKLGFTQDEHDESDYPRMFMHLKRHS